LKEAKAHLSRFVDKAQHERILITRRGQPAALVIGVEGHDIDRIVLGSDAEFWNVIEERRKQRATLTSDDIRRTFGIATRSPRRRPRRRRRKS
jgi:prevent-host-death family protein